MRINIIDSLDGIPSRTARGEEADANQGPSLHKLSHRLPAIGGVPSALTIEMGELESTSIVQLNLHIGGILSTVLGALWGKREYRILIIGLDGAGKTTILYRLQVRLGGGDVKDKPHTHLYRQ